MKLKSFYPLAIFIGVAAIAAADILSDNGKAGKTGSPGETNCTSCHSSYSVNTGGGSISIASSNMPNWQYIPGQVYHISVTVSRSANTLFGVGFEALTAVGNVPVGIFTITNAMTTAIKAATVNNVSRPNVVHKLNGGVGNGSKVFNFDWTAPSIDKGNIIFYVAGNACNGDGNEAGDYVYSSTQIITPANITGIIKEGDDSNLFKVYPNPTHQDLTIEYTLESPSEVKISILNLSGEIVVKLLSEVQFGGLHTEQFNLGNKLSKGIYLVKLEGKSKNEFRKISIQ